MSSNLPPGVTESMIPGNRPEDLAEEAFWDALFTKLLEAGFTQSAIDAIDEQTSPLSWKAIEIARDLGHAAGYNDGKAEAELAISTEEMHIGELLQEWLENFPNASARQYRTQESKIRQHLRKASS
jgi:hypothetical protein